MVRGWRRVLTWLAVTVLASGLGASAQAETQAADWPGPRDPQTLDTPVLDGLMRASSCPFYGVPPGRRLAILQSAKAFTIGFLRMVSRITRK